MISLRDQPGIYFADSFCEILFGNKSFSSVVETSQDSSLCRLKQVHGSTLVEASPDTLQTADGQWTKSSRLILLSKTADCLPILIADPVSQKTWALHAGWRGVENKITTQALAQIPVNAKVRFYIGPHIQQNSFEVDQDVAEKILAAHNHTLTSALAENLCFERHKKYYMNLSALVSQEIMKFGFKKEQIWISSVDTKTEPQFYSFRRGDRDVRNYAAIRIKSIPTQRRLFDFIRSFLMPMLVGKTGVMFFGLKYSQYPDHGYGYGLLLSVLITVLSLLGLIYKYRNIEDL